MAQAVCPACPPEPELTPVPLPDARLVLALPGIHCGGCIASVERILAALPGVRDARVNLTLKRVAIDAAPGIAIDTLTKALGKAGFEAHELDPGLIAKDAADTTASDLLMRLAVAFFAMMNVMLLSVAVWSGAEGAMRDLMHWVSAAIAIPAVLFAGRPFYVSAWAALRGGRLNMDVPITLAILLAIGTSLSETILSGPHAYFDAAVALCCFLLAGRYLDHRTRAQARSAAAHLAAREVPRAIRLDQAGPSIVAVSELQVGDLVRVLPGARVPADGVVAEGVSEIDRSLMTGETVPAAVRASDHLRAGEDNLTGALVMRVTAAGPDTELSRIADLVAVAEAGRNRATALADKAAGLYAPGVHIVAVLAAAGWWVATQDLRVALNIAAAVLIITCPCALGLAVPAVTTAASGRLFSRGLLVKDGTALERLAEVDTVVFDKTGTLTTGVPAPIGLDGLAGDEAAVALALAQASAHPLAKGLAAALDECGVTTARLEWAKEQPGEGITGRWRGQTVRLGRPDWFGLTPTDATAAALQISDGPVHLVTFEDRLRPGAEELVEKLKEQGKRVVLLSGDTYGPVAELADRLGITRFKARLRPEDKAAFVAKLAGGGCKVLMVGDGLNDTAALAGAHVSISPATGLDAARAASDIVLLGDSLAPIQSALRTATKARRRITENFALASLYNLIAVPLAIAGLATPLIAALSMSLSSITVSANALRLGKD
ncbi:MAG: heavy metal translocating P-type ATPase [Pseudomonadota bacterium]